MFVRRKCWGNVDRSDQCQFVRFPAHEFKLWTKTIKLKLAFHSVNETSPCSLHAAYFFRSIWRHNRHIFASSFDRNNCPGIEHSQLVYFCSLQIAHNSDNLPSWTEWPQITKTDRVPPFRWYWRRYIRALCIYGKCFRQWVHLGIENVCISHLYSDSADANMKPTTYVADRLLATHNSKYVTTWNIPNSPISPNIKSMLFWLGSANAILIVDFVRSP